MAAVVGATWAIVATTLGSSVNRAPLAARVSPTSRCCWIVRPGQTLYSIAAREGVAPSDIERANPRLHPTALTPGERVLLPA